MRLIKFRAKPKDNTKWIYGSLVKTPNGTYIEWYEDSICNRVEVDPSTIKQFRIVDCHYTQGDALG
ncbi:hypothetical protein [Prevotella sp.]|nr:hypothetical protein [Prevotella sp.]